MRHSSPEACCPSLATWEASRCSSWCDVARAPPGGVSHLAALRLLHRPHPRRRGDPGRRRGSQSFGPLRTEQRQLRLVGACGALEGGAGARRGGQGRVKLVFGSHFPREADTGAPPRGFASVRRGRFGTNACVRGRKIVGQSRESHGRVIGESRTRRGTAAICL